MRGRMTAGLLAAVTLVACTSAVTTLVKAPSKPAGCTIQIFQNEAAITRPHETVCRVNTALLSTMNSPLSEANIPDDAQKAACECGGDGMVLPAPDAGSGQSMVVTVIRYTGP